MEMSERRSKMKLSQTPEGLAIKARMREKFKEIMEKRARPQSQNERIAELRWEQRQKDLPQIMRQQATDSVWEATLAERRRQAREDSRDCHKGRGDPDFSEASRSDPLGIWRR
jgi:hypothetical protein